MKTLIKILCLSVLWFSCEETEPDIYGCTDSDACNFDSDANIFDNSCDYEEDCNGECGGDALLDDCNVCNGDNSSCEFSLEIQLLENNLPVAGVETYINNLFWTGTNIDYRPATYFEYGTASAGQVFLYLDDLDNNIIDTLIYSVLEAGAYNYQLVTLDPPPTGVSVFSIVIDMGDEIISRYAVHATGIDFNTLTSFYTNESGLITINNQLLFPSLYDLPEITATDETGNYLGNFYIDDFIDKIQVVFLYNDEYKSFDLNLTSYKNEYIFNWEDGDYFYPNMIQNKVNVIKKDIINTNSRDSLDLDDLPTELYLSNPYPNPYN